MVGVFMRKKRKLHLSRSERVRRRYQALKNFGYRKKRKTETFKYLKRHKSYMPRKKKSYRKVKSAVSPIGALATGFLKPTIDSLTSKVGLGVGDEIMMTGLGYVLKGKSGIVGDIGRTLFTVGLFELGRGIGGGKNLFNFGTTTTTTTENDGW